jgi:hypothetical protein
MRKRVLEGNRESGIVIVWQFARMGTGMYHCNRLMALRHRNDTAFDALLLGRYGWRDTLGERVYWGAFYGLL